MAVQVPWPMGDRNALSIVMATVVVRLPWLLRKTTKAYPLLSSEAKPIPAAAPRMSPSISVSFPL